MQKWIEEYQWQMFLRTLLPNCSCRTGCGLHSSLGGNGGWYFGQAGRTLG